MLDVPSITNMNVHMEYASSFTSSINGVLVIFKQSVEEIPFSYQLPDTQAGCVITAFTFEYSEWMEFAPISQDIWLHCHM